MNGFAPPRFEIRRAAVRLPIGLHDLMRRPPGKFQNRIQQFQIGMGAVERANQRLNNADGSVICTRIAPVFEKMRHGNVPGCFD